MIIARFLSDDPSSDLCIIFFNGAYRVLGTVRGILEKMRFFSEDVPERSKSRCSRMYSLTIYSPPKYDPVILSVCTSSSIIVQSLEIQNRTLTKFEANNMAKILQAWREFMV